MAKQKKRFYLSEDDSINVRKELTEVYDEKYFNLWLNSYKSTGLSRDQREYIMRKFWEMGGVAAFAIIAPTKNFMGVNATSFSDGLIGFAPYAPQAFNMYNFPTEFLLINERGVPYIPGRVMKNNIDGVLGFALHSRAPLRLIVANYIKRIVDVEMAIRINLIATKTPTVIEVTPDSEQHAEELDEHLRKDDPRFFVNVKEADSLKGVSVGAPLLVSDLHAYKVEVENELLTFLGIDNIGFEKKERLVEDEANSNNDLIDDYRDCVKDNLEEFCKMIKDILGFDISLKPKTKPVNSTPAEPDTESEGNENGTDN